jgi:predicted O-methyltransferase YrrM
LESPRQCESSKSFLNGKIPPENGRYKTFVDALNLICTRKASIIVETGTSRHGLWACGTDGCSTAIFGEWAKVNKGTFYSVDINEQYLQNAARALGETAFFVHFVHSDSLEFLKNFNQPIDFLYLDSFDFDFNNPVPSQEHHLKEIVAAYHCLTPKSVVMIDDCDLPHGGKGKLAINFLMQKGWKIFSEGYQVILVQE